MSGFTQNIVIPGAIPVEDQTAVAADEDKIADHLEEFLEADDNKGRVVVFSAVMGGVHVYCFPPSKKLDRPHWTIVTMGISGTKMNVPAHIDDSEQWSRCELMTYLPADWEFPSALGGPVDERSWPFEMLRSIGGYVGRTGSWLANLHGLPSLLNPESPGAPFVTGSKLTHCILLEPLDEAEGFAQFVLPSNEVINIYLVVPLTAAEAQWKREVGAERSIFYIVGSKAEGGDNVAVDYAIETHRSCAVEDLGCRARVEEEEGEEDEEEEEDDDDDEDEEEEEDDDDDEEDEDEEEEEEDEDEGGRGEPADDRAGKRSRGGDTSDCLPAPSAVVMVRLRYQPSRLSALEDMVRATLPQTRAFAGCLTVDAYHDRGASQFLLVQRWERAADYASYMRGPSGAGAVAGFMDLLVGGSDGLTAELVQEVPPLLAGVEKLEV